jgi:hypothetical protein
MLYCVRCLANKIQWNKRVDIFLIMILKSVYCKHNIFMLQFWFFYTYKLLSLITAGRVVSDFFKGECVVNIISYGSNIFYVLW